MTDSKKAFITITVQAIIVGLSFLFVKVALNAADTIDLLAHRFTITAACVLLYKVFRPKAINLNISDWKKILPLSIAYPVIFFLMQTLGLSSISSSEAGIIYAVVPIFTFVIARFAIDEKASKAQVFLMVISVLGVIYINVMNGASIGGYSSLGFLLILASVSALSFYNVFIRRLSNKYSAMEITYAISLSGFVIFNFIAVVKHFLTGGIGGYFKPFGDLTFVLAILYLGVFSSFLSALFLSYALSKIEATKVALFNNVSTVVSILAGVIILKEPFYYYHYIGIAAILGGVIGFNIIKAKGKA